MKHGPPGEKSGTAMTIEWVEDWDRLSFVMDMIGTWSLPQRCGLEHHSPLLADACKCFFLDSYYMPTAVKVSSFVSAEAAFNLR